jgi:DNA-binding beta-propeller fold protein YncE
MFLLKYNKEDSMIRFISRFAILFCILALFISCGGDGDGKKVPPKPRAGELYVANTIMNKISVFDASLKGNINPSRTFGDLTGLSSPRGIAFDLTNNEIFVCNPLRDSITVYARIDSGNVNPLRTISGPLTGLDLPHSLAVDSVNNGIFVANINNSIAVYPRSANGNVAPLRTISGSSTDLSFASGLALGTRSQ